MLFRLTSGTGKLSKTSSSSASRRSDLGDIDIEELRQLLESGKNAEYILQSLVTTPNNGTITDRYHSVVNLPTFIKEKEKVSSRNSKIANICVVLRIVRYQIINYGNNVAM